MKNYLHFFSRLSRGRSRTLFIGAAILAGVAGALLLPVHKRPLAPAQTLTLYYRDGKTVLWQTQRSGIQSAFDVYVQSQLGSMYGSAFQTRGAWRVVTTLDPALQNTAQQQMQARQAALGGVQSSAFVAEDVTTGQIVSWADGSDTPSATDAVRAKTPVGTLMLPFDYATYLQSNPAQNASTVFADAQQPLPGYPCTYKVLPTAQSSGLVPNCLWDRDFQYRGPMTLAQALASQRFVPAVLAVANADAQSQYGVAAMLGVARAMGNDAHCYADSGLTYETNCYTAAVIGDGVFATPQSILQGYATLANAGGALPQSAILSASLNGKTMYTWHQPAARQTIRAGVAQTLIAALSDPAASYLNAYAPSFTTQRGTKTAIVDGTTFQKDLAGAVQFSSKYAAGFWAVRAPGQQNAPLESVVVPIAAAWFNAAQ